MIAADKPAAGAAYTVERTGDRTEWLALRKTGIGSSDCAASIGLDPYRSPFELWMEKVGLIEGKDLSDNEAVQMGIRLEPFVAQLYEERTGHTVQRVNATWRSREHPFMIANIDRRVVGMNRGVELKTAGFWAGQSEEWGDPESVKDAVPIRYHCQTQHSLLVAGWPEWDLAALVAGQRFAGPYTISYDPELAEMIITGESAFWQRVVNARVALAAGEAETSVMARFAPPSTRAGDLSLRYPRSIPKPIEATPTIVALFDEILDERKRRAASDEYIETRKIAVCDFMGECDELTINGERLATYRTGKPRETFDSKRHAQEHPDCHAQFVGVGSTSRPFICKEPK